MIGSIDRHGLMSTKHDMIVGAVFAFMSYLKIITCVVHGAMRRKYNHVRSISTLGGIRFRLYFLVASTYRGQLRAVLLVFIVVTVRTYKFL